MTEIISFESITLDLGCLNLRSVCSTVWKSEAYCGIILCMKHKDIELLWLWGIIEKRAVKMIVFQLDIRLIFNKEGILLFFLES